MAPRERWLMGSALSVVVLTVFWWVGVAPALDTLRNAESRHRSLDAQLQTMRALAAEAGSERIVCSWASRLRWRDSALRKVSSAGATPTHQKTVNTTTLSAEPISQRSRGAI